MKSAYELAMERLEKQQPAVKISETLKLEIAEVESVHRAKVAEQEVFLKDQIKKAHMAGQIEETRSLEKQLAHELRRLREDCEAKKEKIRSRNG